MLADYQCIKKYFLSIEKNILIIKKKEVILSDILRKKRTVILQYFLDYEDRIYFR